MIVIRKLKDQSPDAQKIRSGEKANNIYETYKNTVMPNGRLIYSKSYDMEKATMCAYPQSDHALPRCKCVLRWCAKCPCINLPEQETDNQYSGTTPSIRFHVYQITACYTAHVKILLKDKSICRMCKQESSSDK